MRIALLSLVTTGALLFSSVAAAQPGPILPPIIPPTSACGILDGSDTAALLGGTVSVPLHMRNEDPIGMLSVFIQHDPSQLLLTGWSQGAGVQNYINTNGNISCDYAMAPDGMYLTMFFLWSYDTSVYGTEIAVLHYTVIAPAPTTTLVTVQPSCSIGPIPTPPEIEIAIVSGPAVVRGDVDANGGCNLSDAVMVLSYMFTGGTAVTCLDSADLNDDGSITLLDPVMLLQAIFGFGPALAETCDVDASADSLGCSQSTCP